MSRLHLVARSLPCVLLMVGIQVIIEALAWPYFMYLSRFTDDDRTQEFLRASSYRAVTVCAIFYALEVMNLALDGSPRTIPFALAGYVAIAFLFCVLWTASKIDDYATPSALRYAD